MACFVSIQMYITQLGRGYIKYILSVESGKRITQCSVFAGIKSLPIKLEWLVP